MKRFIYTFFICTSINLMLAQNVERAKISGRVYVPTTEKEGITIYNQNSKNGTTTDENGAFSIDVALNDILEFSALQFKDFVIIIGEKIMASKQVSVQLVEDVNKLDEVIVLPYDLSGNLNVDAEAVRTYNVEMSDIYKGTEDLEDYQFTVDANSRIENDPIINPNRFDNGVNFVGLFNMLFKKKKSPKTKAEKFEESISPISKRYSAEYLKTHFEIPLDLTEAFIEFVEGKSYDKALLDKKNEVYLLQHLSLQSQLFLATRD